MKPLYITGVLGVFLVSSAAMAMDAREGDAFRYQPSLSTTPTAEVVHLFGPLHATKRGGMIKIAK